MRTPSHAAASSEAWTTLDTELPELHAATGTSKAERRKEQDTDGISAPRQHRNGADLRWRRLHASRDRSQDRPVIVRRRDRQACANGEENDQ
jgi:hypothetical protein